MKINMYTQNYKVHKVQLINPIYIIFIGIIVNFFGVLESLRGWPYAPFLWGHALLCLVIPFMFSRNNSNGLKSNLWKPRKAFIIGLCVSLSCITIYLFTYFLLNRYSIISDLYGFNLWHAMAEVFNLSIAKYGQFNTFIWSIFLLAIWAPIGEELFYRRLLFKGLRQKCGFLLSALVSASLFGLRHSFQLLYLLPDNNFPLISAIAYFVWAGMFGFIFAWLYEKSNSFWVPCLLHAINLLWAPIAVYYLVYSF